MGVRPPGRRVPGMVLPGPCLPKYEDGLRGVTPGGNLGGRGGPVAEGFTAGELAKATAGLTAWLRGQVENSGAGGIVFGLSGGVDSALLAALCREALGDHCLALILPCHSSPQDVADAEAVARHVGIKVRTVELDSLYDAALALMAPEGAAAGARPQAGSREAMAAANLKPRLRMLTMYYYANLRGWLVAGTTNRAEMTV